MPYCAILQCKNDSRTKNVSHGGISYHRFPKLPMIKEKWIEATGRQNWFPTKTSTICSEHFVEKDFLIKKGKKYLVVTAVPKQKIIYFQEIPENTSHTTEKKQSTSVSTGQPTNLEDGVQNYEGNVNHTSNSTPENTRVCDADNDNIEDGGFSSELRLGNLTENDGGKDLDELGEDTDDMIMSEDPPRQSEKQNDDIIKEIEIDDTSEKQEHVGFMCNCCNNPIVGYRYTCVQCHDYDLCRTCELNGAHAFHYMLRVPGPRLYEEIQTMLEMIRRHLFNSDILLPPGDTSNSTLSAAHGIKSEIKDEVEEVDPLQNITQPLSVSSLLAPADDLEDSEHKEEKEINAETKDLPSENVPGKPTSVHQQTHIPHKMKPPDPSESSVESTDLLSENVPSKLTSVNRQTHFPPKRKHQESRESDEKSITDLPLKNVPKKLTLVHRQTYFPHKRNRQDSDKST